MSIPPSSNAPRTRLATDTALAVALVPYFAPKHHPQATRLLKGVLDAQPNNAEARFARAQIYEMAGNWQEAQKNFQHILDQGGEEKEMVAAKEELGWCLVNRGKLQEGREVLEEVVELRDSRKEKLEEGKEDDEAFARARAWWRLGQTEWKIGGESRAPSIAEIAILINRCRKQGTRSGLVYGVHASLVDLCTSLFGTRTMLPICLTTRRGSSSQVLPESFRVGCH